MSKPRPCVKDLIDITNRDNPREDIIRFLGERCRRRGCPVHLWRSSILQVVDRTDDQNLRAALKLILEARG